MRLTCPLCGDRDSREFTYRGAALRRPADDGVWSEDWDAYVHLRENPAGRLRETWQHQCCGTWLVIERDTVTHRVFEVLEAAEAGELR